MTAQPDEETAGRSRGRLLAAKIGEITHFFRERLQVRVIAILLTIVTVSVVLTFGVSLWQIRNQVYDNRVDSIVEEFGNDARAAQRSFDAIIGSNPGEVQLEANTIVNGLYDPTSSITGVMLMRSDNQESSGLQILEPVTGPATIRDLVTDELRAQTAHSEALHWQSVEIPSSNGGTNPGIVVGVAITIPGTGNYELYSVFSLESEQRLLSLVTTVQMAAAAMLLVLLVLMTFVLVRMVLGPIKEASRNARRIADGAFEVRMDVRGDDELAQLANSFNQMASSLDEQFTRLQKLSKVQQDFVSAVSHELRSPVTTIRMAGQLIYDKREELPSRLQRSAELMQRQLVNLDAMLADLLEISRFDAGAMALNNENVDMSELVNNVIDMTAPLAIEDGVTVRAYASGDTYADVEHRRVERIVRNLLVNAIEHAEGGNVRLDVVGNETAVAVRVVDNGVGMSQDQVDHVFDRFWRADAARVRKAGGTGLGLTIAREDANLHGGEIRVWGVIGEGSSFILIMPREPGSPYVSPLDVEVDFSALDFEEES
ncbi:MtrAB system histidine kinase MtrB [Flaviflexus massiliensis]|uniref:MtrAB system histidine kinase MtrB n=1 Tax=Flaviflexus massiliensis TaxID=1522309 RepID=UPI0006D55954|nr:MtrAB system histidine kinase MtrB [Flaviflexus massiliensis]